MTKKERIKNLERDMDAVHANVLMDHLTLTDVTRELDLLRKDYMEVSTRADQAYNALLKAGYRHATTTQVLSKSPLIPPKPWYRRWFK